MTTYHRYILPGDALVTMNGLSACLTAFDTQYSIEGECVMRGDDDCGILIDITHRGNDIFDGDIELLSGFACAHTDADVLLAFLNDSTCMVTTQVVSYAAERVLDRLWTWLDDHFHGMLVYEGGLFASVGNHRTLAVDSLWQRVRNHFRRRSQSGG